MTAGLRAGSRRIVIPLAVVVATVLLAVARLFVNPGFYFADDTQLGAVGLWYELGDRLLDGQFPVLSPSAWQAGNYFAEGQWGLLNPVFWLIAISTRVAGSVLIVATVVKIGFLALMGLGTYLLARSFTASPSWSAVAGVLAPLTGFTVYMDAPSWVTGLMTVAFLPWAWWGLRRAIEGMSPLPFFLASYLLITVGYVYGVIVLAIVLCEALIRTALAHEWDLVRRVLSAAIWAGLWATVVFLPAVLTAPITKRAGFTIANPGFLSADLSDYGAAAAPTGSGSVLAWFGPVTEAPLLYISWLIPLVPMFAPFTKAAWRGLRAPVTLAVLMLAVTLGPSDFGPLRWPLRFVPYLSIALAVIIAVLATRGFPSQGNPRAPLMATAATVAMGALSWASTPDRWQSILFTVTLQLIVIGILALIATQRSVVGNRIGSSALAAVVIVAVTSGMLAAQMRVFPHTPLRTFAVPTTAAEMTQVLRDASGEVITVGDALEGAMVAETYQERLIANLWYFSEASVMNVYTVLPFSTFSDDLCIEIRGRTCDQTLDRLFSIDTETGERVVDLLGVSEILGYIATYPSPPSPVPSGWQVVSNDTFTWRMARDLPVAGAGDVVWTGAGTRVVTTSHSDTSVSLRVQSVGSDARVVFSRLDWPGYDVIGASRAEPVRDYLLTIDLRDARPGDVVTVTFRPPGFVVEFAAAALAILMSGTWVILRVRDRRRAASPDLRPR